MLKISPADQKTGQENPIQRRHLYEKKRNREHRETEKHRDNRHFIGCQVREVLFYPGILGGHSKGGCDRKKDPEHNLEGPGKKGSGGCLHGPGLG